MNSKRIKSIEKLLKKEGLNVNVEIIESALARKPKKIVFVKSKPKRDLLKDLYDI